MTSPFSYDLGNVSAIYAASRALPPETMELWQTTISGCVPSASWPIRTVVDIGCGTGRFTELLAKSFDAAVVGIDPSEKMLGIAIDVVKETRCSFQQGTAESIPAASGSIDLAFMSMVYHHVQDWEAAHQELHRVLKPNGSVLIRTALRDSLGDCLWTRFFPAAYQLDMERMPSEREIELEMRVGGFRLVAYRRVQQRFATNAQEYLEKIALRGLSGLQLVSDAEFAKGIGELNTFLQRPGMGYVSFDEPIDLFCFMTRGRLPSSEDL